jgi:hypothetical protein
VIEINGSSHDNKQEYDAARDEFLQSVGLTVIHIQDIDIKKQLNNVMEMLHEHAALQPPPAPSKGGEYFEQQSKGGEYSEQQSKGRECFEQMQPEQIFDYIYAVLHSPSYRERYKEFLKIDFPRIPYPENAEQFNKLAEFGAKLRRLHLMENVEPQATTANFPIAGTNEIETSVYDENKNKVFINDVQYFDNVPPEAWDFYIGGYQPAQKWLKDRKGRTLNYDDICYYQRIITVLCETEKIMKEIDVNLQKFK